MARGRRIVVDSSDDEFPDLQDIVSFKAKASKNAGTSVAKPNQFDTNKNTVRRRKLGAIADNPLLRPLGDGFFSTPARTNRDEIGPKRKSTTPQRIELRTRKTKPVVTSVEVNDVSETESVQEETVIEDFSEDDGGSDFEASESEAEEDDESTFGDFQQHSPSKSKRTEQASEGRKAPRERKRSPSPSAQLLTEALEAEERDDARGSGSSRAEKYRRQKASSSKTEGPRMSQPDDLADPLSKLRIHEMPPPRSKSPTQTISRPETPTSPAPEPKYKGLVSPTKKIPRIPSTPHHPNMDTFWNQEFIDEWNEEHSPRKQLFIPSVSKKSPSKIPGSPTKKGEPSQAAVQKAAKKAFSQSKHEVADKFLHELDDRITKGQLSELSAGTGGIRVEWTNKLNTTAGRANWKRETIKSKNKDGETISVRYRHHASIELSTKVIDDSHRLLNVIAHEFCHLANFMISGVTTNPHGREFKGWAAKVTAEFGDDRGIEVTTKHSYDIDFKYIWECGACGLEFKRHSKSINPERHRCGACKGELKQTKPVPRARPSKESEYQRFMKEHMRMLKEENPGSPQKDIMRMVASRWEKEKSKEAAVKQISSGSCSSSQASSSSSASASDGGGGGGKFDGVTKSRDQLMIVDLT